MAGGTFFNLKIFNAINAEAELGLATALTTVSVTFSLDKKRIYSVAERLYEHIKWETFQTRTPLHSSARRKSNERGNCTVLAARTLLLHSQRCRRAL